jgi:hypothetical protein
MVALRSAFLFADQIIDGEEPMKNPNDPWDKADFAADAIWERNGRFH